jgi:thiol-disulfide isomerase/thioredoxin
MKTLKLSMFAIILSFIFNNITFSQGYNIQIQINGIKDTSVILGHYFNKKMYVTDTIQVNSKGQGVFKGEKPLPGGIYIVYMPDKSYFDMLIGSDQMFSINATTPDYVKTMSVKGCQESENFLSFQRFFSDKQKTAQSLQATLEKCKNNADSTKLVQDNLKSLNNDVKSYWNKAINENQGTFLATFLKALQEIEVPEITVPENTPKRDSVIQSRRYYYYKKHYFDNYNLQDDRLLRTPFFADKVETYFTKTLIQIPDTIAAESIKLIEKCRPNEEMFKYMIQYLFNMAAESKQMGMDAVVVALGEKYYLSGDAKWADAEFIKNLRERVSKIKPNLIGVKAHDMTLQSPNEEYFKLSEVKAPFTILVFWEPSCGHCKKEIPKLHEEVWKKYQSTGIKVYAVYTQVEQSEWLNFLEDHNLTDWINVYDPTQQSGFRNYYDIYSTPVIYILDKDKKIVAKRIGAENIPGFLDHEIKLGNLKKIN